MDLVFLGTPPFAATILDALIAAGHRVRAVYTQPPRPAGRGHRMQPSPVQVLAERHGVARAHSGEAARRQRERRNSPPSAPTPRSLPPTA